MVTTKAVATPPANMVIKDFFMKCTGLPVSAFCRHPGCRFKTEITIQKYSTCLREHQARLLHSGSSRKEILHHFIEVGAEHFWNEIVDTVMDALKIPDLDIRSQVVDEAVNAIGFETRALLHANLVIAGA